MTAGPAASRLCEGNDTSRGLGDGMEDGVDDGVVDGVDVGVDDGMDDGVDDGVGYWLEADRLLDALPRPPIASKCK